MENNIVTLRVDLNQLRGNRIVTCREFVVGGRNVLPELETGQVVRVLEEEGDTYLATVERLDGSLVHLWLDLESWAIEIQVDSEFGEQRAEYKPKKSGKGMFADVSTSSEDFAQRKQEEIELLEGS